MKMLAVYLESPIACFNFKERHIEQLRSAFGKKAPLIWCKGEYTFRKALAESDIALTWTWKKEWNDIAGQLRLLATPAAGRDYFEAMPPDCVELHNGMYHGEFMAESLLGMMLGVNRGLFDAFRRQLSGQLWPRETVRMPKMLSGTHAVLWGFGNVARFIARQLKPFGVRITGICRHPEKAIRPECFDAKDKIAGPEALRMALLTADHLVMTLPRSPETDNLLDAEKLALLSPDAVVYNLGRGNSIDEAALADALRNHKLGGACLDVFAQEPFDASSPLAKNLPGLHRFPHFSAFADQYMDRFVEEIIPWIKERDA